MQAASAARLPERKVYLACQIKETQFWEKACFRKRLK